MNNSSFFKRQISLQDAIIQVYRPALGNKMTQALDLFERVVSEAETLTKLGVRINVAGKVFHATPADLEANLDEWQEILTFAQKGRELLEALGFEPLRKNTPLVGVTPIGETVTVQPISTQLPGAEPLEGVLVAPKTDEP